MSELGVRKLVARLITDEKFKNEFVANPKAAAEKSGYSLTEDEIKAIEKMKSPSLKYEKQTGPKGEAVEVSGSVTVKWTSPK